VTASGDLRAMLALLTATALIHAPLARADAQMIAVSNCNGGMSLLVIPGDDDAPVRKGSDCAKACHAMCDRRSKGDGKRG
jgi:hypothetical protein